MSFWSRLFGRKDDEARTDAVISIDQWAKQFGYAGNQYFPPYGYGSDPSGKTESLPNDFVGYVEQCYKSNGIVFAVCMARMRAFSEARLTFQTFSKGRPGDFSWGRELDLFETPWPNGTTGELLQKAIQDVDLCGNHYVVREDGPGGPRLRHLRPDWVDIILSEDPARAKRSDILGYAYKPGNTEDKALWEIYPIDGSNGVVAHWSPLPDPIAQYRGMSWMTPVLNEIISDKAISTHKQKYFEHGTTAGLIISVPDIPDHEFEKFKSIIEMQKTGVQNAYQNLYLGGGAVPHMMAANVQQMDFKTVTGIGEIRICAAAGIPPSMVGLLDGLHGAALNEGTFEAARGWFANGTLRPLWRDLCSAYSVLVNIPRSSRLWFDDREIALLREDRQKVAMLKQTDATTISRMIMAGFVPESVIEAVRNDDWRLLKHSGLYSVQLLPPNISHPDEWGDANKDGVNDAQAEQDKKNQEAAPKSGDSPPAKKSDGPSSANNNPTGSKRKPVGRPPGESKDSEWLDAVTRGLDWSEDDEDDEEVTPDG